MRVLFTVFPSTAHFLPIVPYAWALQSAGHEVCVASAPGVATGVAVSEFQASVTAAGLTAVSCGEPELLSVHDAGYEDYESLLPTMGESDAYAAALGIAGDERHFWDVFYHFTLLTIRNYHPPKPRQDVQAVVDFARRWQPDLVLWDPWFPCGAVAARAAGAAHARVLMAPDYTAWASERFASRRIEARDGLPANPLAETMRPLADLYGFEVDDELLLGQWTIDPLPPGMRLPSAATTISSRCVPFNGADVLPEWLYEKPSRPRLALSLGVSTRMFFKGDWGRLAKLLEAVGGLDVDVVATLNQNQLLDVAGEVPGNVRTIDYVPLTQLLPTCTALLHHGSPATYAVAVANDVPQLVADTDEPTRIVGKATGDGIEWDLQCQKQLTAGPISRFVAGRRAGARIDHQTQSVAEIRELIHGVLTDQSYRDGAAALHREWAAAPSPVALVPVLERLTAEHRG